MKRQVFNLSTKEKLRVGIVARTTERLLQLSDMIVRLGHDVVEPDRADVLLCDDRAPSIDKPTVVLGESRSEHAGQLTKAATEPQIDAAIRAVAVGLEVRIRTETPREFEELTDPAQTLLTPRELQILVAISDGLSNKAIARQLSISQHTVKFHVESLFRKLEVRTRAEAVARGLEQRRREIEF